MEEAEYVLEEIQKCKENGIKEEEIAILFRVHTDARAVVEAMVERKIPFQMNIFQIYMNTLSQRTSWHISDWQQEPGTDKIFYR